MTLDVTAVAQGYDSDPAASMSLHADACTKPEWFEGHR